MHRGLLLYVRFLLLVVKFYAQLVLAFEKLNEAQKTRLDHRFKENKDSVFEAFDEETGFHKSSYKDHLLKFKEGKLKAY